MSALPPKADIAGRHLDVRFVPKADIPGRGKIKTTLIHEAQTLSPHLISHARKS
jgi:hypothetical protein